MLWVTRQKKKLLWVCLILGLARLGWFSNGLFSHSVWVLFPQYGQSPLGPVLVDLFIFLHWFPRFLCLYTCLCTLCSGGLFLPYPPPFP